MSMFTILGTKIIVVIIVEQYIIPQIKVQLCGGLWNSLEHSFMLQITFATVCAPHNSTWSFKAKVCSNTQLGSGLCKQIKHTWSVGWVCADHNRHAAQ